jgi:hypothetical protein
VLKIAVQAKKKHFPQRNGDSELIEPNRLLFRDDYENDDKYNNNT